MFARELFRGAKFSRFGSMTARGVKLIRGMEILSGEWDLKMGLKWGLGIGF